MQPVDKFKLAIGIFYGLFTLHGLVHLLSPFDRRLQERAARRKPTKGMFAAPTRLQRVILLLITGLFTGVMLAGAFHCSPAKLIGLNQPSAVQLMGTLSSLYLLLELRKRHRKAGPKPEA
jgi:hypothetical protein